MTNIRSMHLLFLSCITFLSLFATPSAQAKPRLQPTHVDKEKVAHELRPRKLALLIGINQYEDKHWIPLQYAQRDAKRMREMLKQGGFGTILSHVTPGQTTKRALQRALFTLRRKNTHPQDTVVIYISAHGTVVGQPNRQGQRYVVTSDTDGEKVADTGLSVQWLRAQIKQFPATRKALILATCHTGRPQSKSRVPRGQKGRVVPSPTPYSKTTLILNAASREYAAYESQELRSDVYTHFLLQCVQEMVKARGAQAHVSATEAHSCSVQRTYRYVLQHRKTKQLPGLEADVTGLDAVYLVGVTQPEGQTTSKADMNNKQLHAKGDTPLLQIPQSLLSSYQVQVASPSSSSSPKRMLHEACETVLALPPGSYHLLLIHKRTGKRQAVQIFLKTNQRRMLSTAGFHVKARTKPETTKRFKWSFAYQNGFGSIGENTWTYIHTFTLRIEVLELSFLKGHSVDDSSRFFSPWFVQFALNKRYHFNKHFTLISAPYVRMGFLDSALSPEPAQEDSNALIGFGGGLVSALEWNFAYLSPSFLPSALSLRLELNTGITFTKLYTYLDFNMSLGLVYHF